MASGRPQILIVGAGATGLTLACVLARHGVRFRIVDKLAEIRPHARAICIHSRTLEIFQDLGIADAVVEKSAKAFAVTQFAEGQQVLRAPYDKVEGPFPFLANLEQWKTEGLLEAKLTELGVTVERETELVAVEERLDGVRAMLRLPDGSSDIVDAPWLVGCDGAHSAVRHLNREHFPGETDPRCYIIADVLAANAPYGRDEVMFFISDSGFLGCNPLPEGRTLLYGNFDEDTEGHREAPALADLQAIVEARYPKKLEVSDPRWISWYRTNYRLTPHYRHGRTLLAGDAAHIHSSIGAQGMNTGIQDAYNLGWKLALVSQGGAPQSLLDSYETERRAIASDVLATTKAMADRVLSFGRLSEAERDRRYRHAHVPEADRLKAIRHTAALDLDYRKSPICVDHRHGVGGDETGGGLHAGAEAVDAGPLQVDGKRLTAFELFAGPHHTLLMFADADGRRRHHANIVRLAGEVARVYGDLIKVCVVLPADADAAGLADTPATIVRDVDGAMGERYGAQAGRTYLIRPDGYVGWCSNGPSLTAFRDYLAKVLVCP